LLLPAAALVEESRLGAPASPACWRPLGWRRRRRYAEPGVPPRQRVAAMSLSS